MRRNALHLAQWKLKDEGGRSVDKMVGGLEIDFRDTGQGCGRNVDRVAYSDR